MELNGLRELTEQVASGLAGHEGVLLLDGLETLTSDCATHLCNHRGPVSVRGIKRLSADAYAELTARTRQGFAAWLPPSVLIEQEAVPERFVRWSDMAAEDTVDNYVRHMTTQADVGILVDTVALQRLNLSAEDRMSAPVGTIETHEQVGTIPVTKRSARIVADVMGLEEAVVWIAEELNHRLSKNSEEHVVVLTNGDSFLVTVRPKTDEQRGPPEWEEIELSQGERSLWYHCQGAPDCNDTQSLESGWQPPWHRRIGGGMF